MQFLKRPIRTCISCKERFEQSLLLRLQCIDKKIIPFSGTGRSFYLCNECLKDTNRVLKSIYKQCKNKADYKTQLKEIEKEWKTK